MVFFPGRTLFLTEDAGLLARQEPGVLGQEERAARKENHVEILGSCQFTRSSGSSSTVGSSASPSLGAFAPATAGSGGPGSSTQRSYTSSGSSLRKRLGSVTTTMP